MNITIYEYITTIVWTNLSYFLPECTAAETDEHCIACTTDTCTACESGYELNSMDVCEGNDIIKHTYCSLFFKSRLIYT